ncbi:N-acetylglucosamine-6-phosphate deacetylase [Clostridium swellfunianum]|uniref:N-acetylglucosamine-6-phosphate deacetylase n=1 Tax=Clostridium swellfunianum TaxID=1367462 RepID=UPI002030A131|nr:N-acetylglucosamine-6-phosphate deacetylase [Clostridium swellfunianum]MCM0649662.1 N-acetylglucosamine-6-phosphate deacetylase [Clostridium swellfunianum]
MLILKNCSYLSKDRNFVTGNIAVDKDTIVNIGDFNISSEDIVVDLNGKKVIPGLIDIHFHGAVGYDVMDASPEEFNKISSYLAKCGTTSYLATTITSSKKNLFVALSNIKEAANNKHLAQASIEGVHIEGPYINSEKKGCHDVNYMRAPLNSEFDELKSGFGDTLELHFTIAPEIQGAEEFIKYACKSGATVSIGHTNAKTETVKAALGWGANIFTHLYNAMRGIDHREPGVAGTALNSDSYVELISDGVHVHPDIVNITYKLKGSEKLVLVTDAMKAAGLGDGTYDFGGFKVIVKDGIARQENGTLASSTLTMLNAVKNIMKFTGASLEEAVRMGSENPARAAHIFDRVGSIETGKKADLVVLNDNLEVQSVYCRGKQI